ncbi:hypothetical protein BOTBODRAFT_104437 [Botryobasidium botryosum FD-172 SS1]|uniref:LIM zinc-binding domain-containing protein n=1 Tax=Botryobasidium botryosum (strain FD-172 SS1) TaxID=930990 RepID=A0A067N1M1_BOTB1|nr:hypothetical protein BOTBODRAFT_104437 [Botryobasidium botryosum FD-172 SS1]
METLVEEPTEGGESIAGSSSSSSGGGAGAEGKGQNLGGALGLAYSRSNPLGSSALHIKAPPTRSLTSPAGQSKKRGPSTREKKVCMRCEKTIEDGRWIPVDTDRAGKSGVLCEKDWKEMYLPKCRRCELPIERQAVSSADGQLKGKYHRDCFNCHECHTPFPDKSFYVFDGKPFCKYHYHRANRSLCMLASCGEPIEGPCAEDHDARRYHPEHMLCDEEGCDERLVEYWEMAGGRKFCEGCARAADVDSRWGGSSVADDMDMSVYSGSSGGSGSALQYATTAPLRLGRSRSALAKKEAEAEAGKGVGEAKDKDKELNKGREQEQEQDSGAKKAKAKAMKRRTRFLQLGADGEEEEL